ncbi:SusC/RagA family TonB-linked outer membrane protein [Flavobacterium wongokense]|uniref:SusC/RagA family TonB-linked outer membrane protein n=1 Tax=Flavobacterium wongokense TaxID=2910674 RepID=UPI001F3BE528|nr:SusC/RagA family TonB-linked outer membrane protein [Flavobacterium sp. WG47]MCF6132736.1 SusC/RagA family TonB-linked outer membrane protein [Flavobacterium sp. WG47]
MNKNSLYKARAPILYALIISLVYCNALFAQNRQPTKITGTVGDANGPLQGVTITVKGTADSTISDNTGKYALSAKEDDVLIFSYIGFKTTEISIAGKTNINLTMADDATTLKEVTINAGYYTVRDKERTGSISKITSKDIEKQPVTNVLAAMQGRMAGVDITQTTGMPGGGYDIRIRGINSLRSAGNAPMFVVDGVPFASDAIGNVQTSTNIPTPTSPLNTLTPNDIESIEILKDADATAIYGSRGANGVVLITTKKGKTGKTQFTAAASTAVGTVTKFASLMNTEQYLAMRDQAFANDGISPIPDDAYDVNGTWDRNRYTDWQKELLGGTAEMHTLQASVSGGTAQTSFLISANSFTQGTVFPGAFKYKKGGAHVSLGHESIDKRFKISFSGTYDVQDNDQPSRDLTYTARSLAPNAPALYDAAGNLNWENATWDNPLATLYAKALAKTNSLLANTSLSYQLPYGFMAKGSFGFTDLKHEESRSNISTVNNPIYGVTSANSSIYFNDTNRKSWIAEPQLQWQKQFGTSKVDVLAGATYQNQVTDRLVQQGSGFASNSLLYNLASASTVRVLNNDEIVYRYQAFFGRVNYTQNDRYILNFTGRRDGSSRFGPGKQFSNFGAVGAAWIFSEEDFVKDKMKFLSFGKLRGSYGVAGNDQIGDYQFLDTYQSSTGVYDGSVGLTPIRLFNPNFSWESNKKLEAAIEAGFLNDRVFITASFYSNRSSNQLVGMPLPSTTGFSTMQTNLDATVENRGTELTMRTVNVKKKDFEWTTNFTISWSKNKLLEFPGLATSSYRNQYVIGQSINIVKLYHFAGVNPQTGVYEFEDVNGDGSITFADDAQTTRDLSPKYFGGLQNYVRYKNFQLDFLFQFVNQLNRNASSQYTAPGDFSNQPTSALGGWQQPGDIANTQIYTSGLNSDALNANDQFVNSDAGISEASYIRLKNIALTYSLPNMLKGLQCKLNVQAQNLFTITPYQDGDPEFRSFNYLPPLRIISFGAEIKF